MNPLARETLERWVGYGRALYDVTLKPLGLRTLVLAGFAVWLLAHDALAAKSYAFNLGLVCAGLAVLQAVRKLLMPYLDQAEVVRMACATPMGSAIVYAATRAFDAVVLLFLLFTAIR